MIFLILVLTVLAFIHGYVGFRVIPSLDLNQMWKVVLWLAVAVLTPLSLVGPVLRFQGIENRFSDTLSWVGYTSLGFFLIALALFAFRDLSWGLWVGASKLFAQETNPVQDPSRRQFIKTAVNIGLLTFTTGLSAYGFARARRKPDIVEVDVPIGNLPDQLDGMRIAQISDIHVGPTIKRDFVEMVTDEVNALKPDMIALTGDLVDGSVNYLSNDVAPLEQLKAPLGKYFITGNHEYYSGAEHWLEKTAGLGFINLVNEHRLLEINGAKLTVAGVTDLEAGRMLPNHATDPAKALAGAPADSVKILLAHQPGSIYAASKLGVDLQLSGHTHGGQFKPYHYFVKQSQKFLAGLFNHEGTQLYVNSGTGYWGPPLRLGVPNEITVLTLKKA